MSVVRTARGGYVVKFLVGLVGRAGYGKNTVATLIRKTFEPIRLTVAEVAFADGVREECRVLYGWNGLKDDAGRTLLQNHGMSRRSLDADYWVKQTFRRIDSLTTDVVVITDVRFRNEAAAISARGGEIWRVARFDANGDLYHGNLTPEQRAHVSETEMDGYPCDRCVVNVDLVSLRRNVREQLLDVLRKMERAP